MAIAEAVVPSFDMGRVVKRTFSVIGNNLATFALLSLIVAVPFGIVSWAALQFPAGLFRSQFRNDFDLTSDGLFALTQLIFYVASFVLQAAVIHSTIICLNGRKPTALESLSISLGLLPQIVAVGVLAVLGMLGGFLLLFIPGIILAIMWSVVVPACVVERTGVFGAFRRSSELTRGYRGSIFGLMLAFGVLNFIIAFVIGIFAGMVIVVVSQSGAGVGSEATGLIVAGIIGAVSAVLSSALTAAVYYELRVLKDGIGPEALAAVFD